MGLQLVQDRQREGEAVQRGRVGRQHPQVAVEVAQSRRVLAPAQFQVALDQVRITKGYREKLTGYVLPVLGDFRLSELRRRDAQDLVDELLADGLSPASVRNTIDPLRAIYRRAIQREQVAINPTSNLDLPTSGSQPIRIAPPEEAFELLEALPPEQGQRGRPRSTPG